MNREEAIMYLSENHCGECGRRHYFSSTLNLLKHIDEVNKCFSECEIGQKIGEAFAAYIGNIQDEVEG